MVNFVLIAALNMILIYCLGVMKVYILKKIVS